MPRSSQESEDLTWGWSVPDGAPSPSPRSTPTPPRSSRSDGRESRTSVTSFDVLGSRMAGETFDVAAGMRAKSPPGIVQHSGPAAFPARISASLGSDEAWAKGPDPDSPTASSLWLSDTVLGSSSSRTFRDFSPVMAGETWRRSSVRWSNSGMAWDTGCSTLATSECRSADGVCSSSQPSLTEILEPPQNVPDRYSLSARAAQGILRRAEKRGRTLPAHLEEALATVAGMTATRSTGGGTRPCPGWGTAGRMTTTPKQDG